MRIKFVFNNHSACGYKGDKILILAGGSKEDPKSCFSICEGYIKKIPDLNMTHEKADDRIMAHVEYAAKSCCFQ